MTSSPDNDVIISLLNLLSTVPDNRAAWSLALKQQHLDVKFAVCSPARFRTFDVFGFT